MMADRQTDRHKHTHRLTDMVDRQSEKQACRRPDTQDKAKIVIVPFIGKKDIQLATQMQRKDSRLWNRPICM